MNVAGLDLAGVEARETGFCVMDERMKAETSTLHSDAEILEEVVDVKPRVVAIDAPLSLPRGRCCLRDDCACRGRGHLRECDRALKRMGIRFFPVTLGPMRKLTERGLRLKSMLREAGLEAVEVYPGGAQDVLGLPRKHGGLEALRRGLEGIGVSGLRSGLSSHELDAVTCALVGILYAEARYIALGDPGEGLIIMPEPRTGATPRHRKRK